MKCLENRKIKKSIPYKSDYLPNRHICLIVPHTLKSPGAFSAQLQRHEYDYMKDFYLYCLIPELKERGLTASIHYRDKIGIAGAYEAALTWKPFLIMEWHFNAFNGNVKGFEILHREDLKEEVLIMDSIMDVFHDVLETPQRRKINVLKGERGFRNVSQTSKIPSILLEPFFGDNKFDAKNFDDKKEVLAKRIAQEIEVFSP